MNTYRKGTNGHPCLTDLDNLKDPLIIPLRPAEHHESEYRVLTQLP
jgi:hypothetical protein